MKKNYFILVLIIAFVAFGCKKSDSVTPSEFNITGTWNVDSIHTIEYGNNIKLDEYTQNMKGTTAVFKTDGKFIISYMGEDPESGEYRYDAVAKTISLKYDGETSFTTAPIIQQTAGKLVIRSTVNYDTPVGGVDKEIVTIYLSR